MTSREDVERMQAELPRAPREVNATGFGLWLSSIAIQTIIERGYDPEEIRRAMFVLLAGVLIRDEPRNEKLLSEFAEHLENARDGRFNN